MGEILLSAIVVFLTLFTFLFSIQEYEVRSSHSLTLTLKSYFTTKNWLSAVLRIRRIASPPLTFFFTSNLNRNVCDRPTDVIGH